MKHCQSHSTFLERWFQHNDLTMRIPHDCTVTMRDSNPGGLARLSSKKMSEKFVIDMDNL